MVFQDSWEINVKSANKQWMEIMTNLKKENIFSPGIKCEGYILTWYDRTVTKCEPAAPIPETLSWLHPGYRRYSRLLKIVDRQAVDAEEGGFT